MATVPTAADSMDRRPRSEWYAPDGNPSATGAPGLRRGCGDPSMCLKARASAGASFVRRRFSRSATPALA
jgi:hypothetical protein